MNKRSLHFIPTELMNSNDEITIAVIGAGGTGSAFIKELIGISILLKSIKDKNIKVIVIDPAKVKESNLGRQNFYPEDIGQFKAETLVKRINRNYAFKWIYENTAITKTRIPKVNIIVLCVDKMEARTFIYENFQPNDYYRDTHRQTFYILDLGNDRFSGQIFLSSKKRYDQPEMKDINTISYLKTPLEYFGKETLINALETQNDTPSCSSYEAILSQDLFINKAVAMHGARMIWSMFMNGYVEYQAYFINHESENFKSLKL